MSDPAKLAEVTRLAGLVCDDALSSDDIERLDTLLLDDITAQQCYLRNLEIDAALGWRGECRALPNDLLEAIDWTKNERLNVAVAHSLARSSSLTGRKWASAASISLVALVFYGAFAAVAWNLWPNAEIPRDLIGSAIEQPAEHDPQILVAALTAAHDCKWGGDRKLKLGDWLNDTAIVQLESGAAEFTMQSGAVLELTGPSVLNTSAANEVCLQVGKLTAIVPPRATGFKVITIAATIIDRGTEFGVTVATDGATEVHVVRGLVEAQSNQAQASIQTLHANEALRFDATLPEGVPVAADMPRFARHLSGQLGPIANRTCQRLPLDEILPGTERATLVANGDFDDVGMETPPRSGSFPHPEIWGRVNHMFVRPVPADLQLPAIFGRSVAMAHIDGVAPVGMYSQPMRLQPNTEYVLSAYLWNLGDVRHRLIVNVDLVDLPGEPNLTLDATDPHGARGCFAYQTFNTNETGTNVDLRLFFDNFSADDSAWPHYPVGAAWDRIAITPVGRFSPPLLRKGADEVKSGS